MREYFRDAEHALAAGIVLGSLTKSSAGDTMLGEVRPFYDSEGNYTNQMMVTVGDRQYTLTIEESVSEAMEA